MEIKDLNLEKDYSLLINGEWTKGAGSDRIDVISPANGEHLATITDAVNEDVDRAVEAAQEAFKTWSQTDVKERAAILNQIADLIDDNADRLALIETLDNGKPIRETSAADIPLAADHFRYFASVIRSEEDQVKFLTKDTMSMIIREPIGVVGQIIPWNFPFLMAAWKLAPALAAGCVVVIKPASDTSLSLLELAKLVNPILPKGVLNVITGRGSKAGDYLKHHKGLDKLAFTGSTAVGRDIGIAAAENLIPATLELGGKSANIFFEDMDMEQALEGAQLGILFNQGEVCSAGSRILVQESIYDEFIERLIEEFKQVKVGLPWEKETQLGAQANPSQHKKVDEYVQIGLDEGAELLTGGQALTTGDLDKGYYYEPTLLLAKNDMRVAQEEIFGPVATVIKFKDVDEAIQIANDSDYGLGGGVFTTNLNTAFKVARGVRTGRVWVNTYNSFEAGAPFGGYKDSGIGRETHKMILNAYTQAKNIYVNLGQGRTGMF
ncbi:MULTISPECIES: aldehyde dehydrogenase family protein [Aerococcus]|uniref:Putative aldehyde dehydrogenase AldA n=2 Tax=Aerococcus TaxID=1375 RepID=A0A5N1GK32_9LACT|nr:MULTISPECIES: aldehyde dehydrogenase family protein [Aerococcus]KAA9300549.1 aldehyde dehydrogenase family protein [Aerococcus sanguinicola]MDK6369654.1 aldehyde dehydrogenase family protein [Aerococcus sp. UMB9870]MDK6680159.1 aldehyde dehydrogenase family protein [Aerococcus sp. UMB8608]MDK6686320.1 aldehyde dehydrogenase family protein [Aerococcus sp. UMB8623]MDK6940240.1 aldehyde dehydrogenase family protein [Aerococcus sp. UMB8487]